MPVPFFELSNTYISKRDDWEYEKPERAKLRYQLWLAEQFRDKPELYFPWNLDLRGRMYPLFTVSVHPQADDVGKAPIEFANGKKLGEDGSYWLAVHGANTYGEDKLSLDDRVRWIEEHEAEIIDSAINPMKGDRFWAEADGEPFQFLAFCIEWYGYKEQGEGFVSHIPVAIDMSCNGLQHLSYLSGDWLLASRVNALYKLSKEEKPTDYYGLVAEKVQSQVEKVVKAGDRMAQLWEGKINRAIVKRNVMTLPYGATKDGFKNQLMKELRKRDAADKNGSYLDVKANWEVCNYLAETNRKVIKRIAGKVMKEMERMQILPELFARKGFLRRAILA